jgi:hypothetical protein
MTVTADSTLWTADTHCVTADGRIVCIDAEVVEPVNGSVTADSSAYSADNTIWPTADGGAAGATDRIDAVVAVVGTVIVLEAANALDQLDAAVQPAVIGVIIGGGYRRPLQPETVEGYGYAILPPLVGEAHGVVIAASNGAAVLRHVSGDAAGAAGVAGRSAARLALKAAASGERGQAGAAVAVFKGFSADGSGNAVVRGKGFGVIGNIAGAAIGQQDDDEAAAIVAWLLAA